MSELAKKLMAVKIFVEIVPQSAQNNPRDLWWKRASTREPLEVQLDNILAAEFNAKFDYLNKMLSPFIEGCVYCNGGGRIQMGGADGKIESANCSWCFPFRETLRLLPPPFPVKEPK